MRLLDRCPPQRGYPRRCRTGWCGSAPRCCWPIPTSISPSGSAPSTSCALRVAGPCGADAGPHGRGVARTRPDARRGRLRRNLRPATAIHDVPDLLDRRRHPQPRPGDASPSPRPTATPACRPPVDEAPDHLPVVLEFAATVDPVAGRRLLVEHRVPIDVLRDALTECGSPYAHTVAAVCETLPAATDQEVRRAQRLAQAGPPAEAVGLQPFTLTVPPRRTEGDR